MIDVRDFGAAGDGSADDTDAIQHAVDEGGGALVLPRGTYRLTRPVEVPLDRRGPIALSGSGGTARLCMEGAGPALRLVGTHDKTADPEGFRPEVWERERMPTVADLEIVGHHDQADGIELRGTMQATIRGVLVRRCRFGLHLVGRNRNLLLADVHLYHGRPGGIGVYFDGVNLHQANIVGCHISYFPHAGIKVQRSEVRNLQITGCDIEYNYDPDRPDSADVWIDAREGTVREGTIASNTIQAKHSPGGANIRIEGPPLEAASGTGLWTIAGNILQSQAVNLLLRSCRGIAVTGNSFASGYERSIIIERCRHIVVGANTFDHNPDYGGGRIDGITIRGSAGISLANLILDDIRAGGPDGGGAIEVYDSREVAIVGCQVLDPAHRGIDLIEVHHARVSDCTVLDRRDPPAMREAIRLSGSGRGNLVLGNLVGRGTRGGLVIAEGTATVANNIEVAR
ncbi:MAG: right-handed parallel beta-helix repeat-containing protein [Isosphaeraceae bacterium]|nr:right-handed parallel beta-helix repeat-containing protein [Isosphaeraceae bacterium]